MSKTYTEARTLIKAEITSIKKRDGELGPTPYVVLEVASRLRTLTPWEGYDPHKPLAANIRDVVEELLKGYLNPNHPVTNQTRQLDVIIPDDPIEQLECEYGSFHNSQAVDQAPIRVKKAKLKRKLATVS